MSSNDISFTIFFFILGIITMVMFFKINRTFYSRYKEKSFGSGENGSLLMNILKILPYPLFKGVFLIIGLIAFSIPIILISIRH